MIGTYVLFNNLPFSDGEVAAQATVKSGMVQHLQQCQQAQTDAFLKHV